MLPPSLSTLTMNDNLNKTQSLSLQPQPQQIIQHHQSSFIPYTSFRNDITSLSSSISNNFLPTVPFNTSSIKHFFNKTLAKVVQTNFSDYTAEILPAAFVRSSNYNESPNFHAINNAEVYDNIDNATQSIESNGSSGLVGISNGFDSYTAAADMAVTSLSHGSHHVETTTAFPTAQTVATFIAGNKNRATTIIVYPTVSPESIVIPIVSCIFGFPILAFIVICCLRHRAKMARERDRRRNYDMQDHAVSLVRFNPIHRLNYRSSRAISLRPERSLSQGFTSLELDTVVEERCSDIEQTQTEILHPESPMDSSTISCKISISSS